MKGIGQLLGAVRIKVPSVSGGGCSFQEIRTDCEADRVGDNILLTIQWAKIRFIKVLGYVIQVIASTAVIVDLMFTARLPAVAVPVPDHLTQDSILILGRFSVGDDEDIVSLAAVFNGADMGTPAIELTCAPLK